MRGQCYGCLSLYQALIERDAKPKCSVGTYTGYNRIY